MYLAEGEIVVVLRYRAAADWLDRILCWELVSKRGCKWILHYVKSAYAITDVPDRVSQDHSVLGDSTDPSRYRSSFHSEDVG